MCSTSASDRLADFSHKGLGPCGGTTRSATPGCEKRWVFVNPTPLFLFAATPVFMSASVQVIRFRV